jgi:hypothetical protein
MAHYKSPALHAGITSKFGEKLGSRIEGSESADSSSIEECFNLLLSSRRQNMSKKGKEFSN